MTFDAVRQAISAEILNNVSGGLIVTVDNDPFDWSNPPATFNHIEISFQGANQIGMSANPKSRDVGYVYLCTYVQTGAGSDAPGKALDWLRGVLEYKILSAPGARITFEAMQPDGTGNPRGWYTSDAKVLFRVHPA